MSLEEHREKILAIIIENSGQINTYKSKKEVYIEKIRSYLEAKNELHEKRNILENELKEINSEWDEPLQEIKNIKIDELKQRDLSRTIETFRNIKQQLESLKKKKRI